MKRAPSFVGVAAGVLAAAVGIIAPANAATSGKNVYDQNCSSCHQANGTGVPGTFPPLAHNRFVSGNPKPVIQVVRNGKTGPLTVNGQKYDGQMPAWKGKLSDDDIAAVITYVRSSWGNHGARVTAAQVKKDGG